MIGCGVGDGVAVATRIAVAVAVGVGVGVGGSVVAVGAAAVNVGGPVVVAGPIVGVGGSSIGVGPDPTPPGTVALAGGVDVGETTIATVVECSVGVGDIGGPSVAALVAGGGWAADAEVLAISPQCCGSSRHRISLPCRLREPIAPRELIPLCPLVALCQRREGADVETERCDIFTMARGGRDPCVGAAIIRLWLPQPFGNHRTREERNHLHLENRHRRLISPVWITMRDPVVIEHTDGTPKFLIGRVSIGERRVPHLARPAQCARDQRGLLRTGGGICGADAGCREAALGAGIRRVAEDDPPRQQLRERLLCRRIVRQIGGAR